MGDEEGLAAVLQMRRVVGDSMRPGLHPGQIIIALRARRARLGEVVIVRHGGIEKIKRVHEMKEGRLFVLGDNPAASTDSRSFGWLPRNALVARVIWPKTRHTGRMEISN